MTIVNQNNNNNNLSKLQFWIGTKKTDKETEAEISQTNPWRKRKKTTEDWTRKEWIHLIC